MKVSASDLETMREAIAPLDTEQTRQSYRDGDFPRANLVQNLNKRYRFDLLYASGALRTINGPESYYSDAHLDTALRSIVPDLT